MLTVSKVQCVLLLDVRCVKKHCAYILSVLLLVYVFGRGVYLSIVSPSSLKAKIYLIVFFN